MVLNGCLISGLTLVLKFLFWTVFYSASHPMQVHYFSPWACQYSGAASEYWHFSIDQYSTEESQARVKF